MGITEIEVFNQELYTNLTHDDYDTLGGWPMAELGPIPHRGDSIVCQGLNITVVVAGAKRTLWLQVQPEEQSPSLLEAAE